MALDWIGDALSNVLDVFPRLQQIQYNEAGIKFKRGTYQRLEPGLSIYWPVTSNVETANTALQIIVTEDQTLTLDSDVTVTVSGLALYRISDVEKYLVMSENAEECIQELVESSIRSALRSFGFQRAIEDSEYLDEVLTDHAASELDQFGIEVDSVKLTKLAKGQVLIHSGIVFSDGSA